MRCAQKEGSASRVLIRHRPEAYGVSRRHDFAGEVVRAGGWFDRDRQGDLFYKGIPIEQHPPRLCRLPPVTRTPVGYFLGARVVYTRPPFFGRAGRSAQKADVAVAILVDATDGFFVTQLPARHSARGLP